MNLVTLGRTINIIILTLACYSIYIKFISKFEKGSILRELWILLCGIISFFDVFILKLVKPGTLFIICNKIQLISIAAAVVLIIMDFFKSTGINNRNIVIITILITFINSLMLILTPSIYFNSQGEFVISFFYYIFWIVCLILGVIPVILFFTWFFTRKKDFDVILELLLVLAAYIMIYIASFFDGMDISIVFKDDILPKITVAVLFLGITGLVTISYKFKKIVDKLNYFAEYDDVTNTYKRKMGIKYIDNLIFQRKITKKKFSVILFDVNNFKKINDMYDHVFGNITLEEISKALKNIVNKSGIVCRTGGDEFMIITNGNHDSIKTSDLLRNIVDFFSRPLNIKNNPINILIRMGISIFPEHGRTTSELLQNADYSHLIAKQLKGNQILVYSNELENEKQKSYCIEEKLKNTLFEKNEKNIFKVFYQPKVNNENRILGFEALLRWYYNDEFISPDNFIPVAEKTGLIIDLGYFLINQAFKQLVKWNNSGQNISLAINLGIHQLRDPNILDVLIQNIEMYNINPGLLEIEITESSIMDFSNDREMINILNDLYGIGVKISIDDFGTGYSSFSRIIDLPINVIKIDKSFIKNLPDNYKSIKVCLSIIRLAHELNIKTVAEGVETKEQADFLFKNNCDLIQGYYFYKPMPDNEIDKLIS